MRVIQTAWHVRLRVQDASSCPSHEVCLFSSISSFIPKFLWSLFCLDPLSFFRSLLYCSSRRSRLCCSSNSRRCSWSARVRLISCKSSLRKTPFSSFILRVCSSKHCLASYGKRETSERSFWISTILKKKHTTLIHHKHNCRSDAYGCLSGQYHYNWFYKHVSKFFLLTFHCVSRARPVPGVQLVGNRLREASRKTARGPG